METSSRLIPLVDDLTHILVEAGKNKLTKRIKLDGGWPTVNLRGAERRDVMANKMYKDRLVIVGPLRINKAANGLPGLQ